MGKGLLVHAHMIGLKCIHNKESFFVSFSDVADSDQDSDKSDGETVGNITHLPRRILGASAELARGQPLASVEETHGEGSGGAASVSRKPQRNESVKGPKRKKVRNWRHRPPMFRVQLSASDPDDVSLVGNSSPCEFFQQVFTRELLENILEQSNLYASQHGRTLNMTMEELLGIIGVMMMTGYRTTHNKRHLWSAKDDVSSVWAQELMPRNRFLELLQNLHLADNSKISTDRYYKVRPYFEHLNNGFKTAALTRNLSVDETMVPYYGRHSTKQFIRGKPVRYGYKLWCLAASSGYLYHAEPYCGADTQLADTGMGKGADVVLGLLDKCSVPRGHTVYFDNLFTSLELLDALSDLGLGGCGTVRENRLGGAPFSDKKVLEKKQRGAMEWLSDGDNLVVRWNDNRVVTVATNCEPLEPLVTASRYVKKQGGRVNVEMPGPLHSYNTHMGGVDLFDQCVAGYRSTIRSKKWWWPLFQWGVDAARTNAWFLSQRHVKGQQLPFLRELTYVLIKKNTVPRPPSTFAGRHQTPEDLRYDGLHHWPAELESRFHRCKVCNSRTNMSCEKCAIPIHPKCMKMYHTP